jgi:hypothetical protein
MASLIHELENNEALLLMYLTDELPVEDRVEVEQLLASDLGLRMELGRIASAYELSMDGLARLDRDQSAIPAENHAVRQAMRAMKQWQVDRLTRLPAPLAVPKRHVPAWMYPLAGAAALLIGTISWWGFGGQFHFSGNDNKTVAMQSPNFLSGFKSQSNSAVDFAKATDSNPLSSSPLNYPLKSPLNSLSGDHERSAKTDKYTEAALTTDRLAASLAADVPSGDPAVLAGLARAETQAGALHSDSTTVASDIFMSDANP